MRGEASTVTWIAAVGLGALALAFVLLPGGALAWALRLPRLIGAAVAPLLGIAEIGIAAELAGMLDISWTALEAAISSLVWAALALATGILIRCRWPVERIRPDRHELRPMVVAAVAGLGASALVFAIDAVIPIGAADTIAQSYDTLWHYDIVTWILQHHDAATTHVGAVDGTTGGSSYYPDAWHTIVAFVVASSGASIPLAASAIVLVETVILWPVGLMSLSCTLFGRRPFVIAAAGIFSGVATAFPWHFIDWGVLYANGLSMSLLPAALALLIHVLRSAGQWTSDRVLAVIATGVALGGFAFTQPNTLFTAAVILFPLGFVLTWNQLRSRRGRLAALLGGIGFTVAFGAVWLTLYALPALRRTVTFHWPPQATVPQAIGEALLGGFNGNPGLIILPVLSVLGAAVLIRGHARWFIAAYGIAVALYVISDSTDGRLRSVLTGFWYTDERRLAGVVAMLSVVLAVGGAAWIADILTRRLGSDWNIPRRTSILSLLLIAPLALDLLSPGQFAERSAMQGAYHDQTLLTDSEASFMAEASTLIPPGAVVANMPADGSAFGYSLDGIAVLFSSLDGSWLGPWGPDQALVGSSLNQIATRPDVCVAARRLHVDYVLNLDPGFFSVQLPDEDPLWLGMRISPGTPGFTALLIDGDRGLYRVDACDLDAGVSD